MEHLALNQIRPINPTWRSRSDCRADKSGAKPRRVLGTADALEPHRFGKAIGSCRIMRELFECLERLAVCDVNLLLEGETGTGKDVLAESVHFKSARAEAPFVVFDCGATAPTLAESELFGHERGAFTGAGTARPGVFEQASGGTLFLDELGELPLELQPKLLRVLEKRQIRRLGGSRMIDVDVRVIAATNRQLLQQVQLGRFRADLYYRLETTKLTVPPLRERMSDLPLLVQHFAETMPSPEPIGSLTATVWESFFAYHWPGNVRELRNAVQRFFLMPGAPFEHHAADTSALMLSAQPIHDFSPASKSTAEIGPLQRARRDAALQFERQYVKALLTHTAGNVTQAAALAGISRQMMTRLAKKHRASTLNREMLENSH